MIEEHGKIDNDVTLDGDFILHGMITGDVTIEIKAHLFFMVCVARALLLSKTLVLISMEPLREYNKQWQS